MAINTDIAHNPSLEGDLNYEYQEPSNKEPESDPDGGWLQLAREAWRESNDWYENSLRNQWEHNIALFKGQHPPGSKYATAAYKHRSKLVRPKTRGVARRFEAAAAAAFFSTTDSAIISPGNSDDPEQQASASILHELINYRTEETIPWFMTVIGALQDTENQGICWSKQTWDLKEIERKEFLPVGIDEDGNPSFEEVPRMEVVKNEPRVDLIPPDYMRIDPAASWIDPVNSSPYIIEEIPMFAGDFLSKTKENGAIPWRPDLTLQMILTHGTKHRDEEDVNRARDGYSRTDRHEDNSHNNEFSTVWLRHYIMRRNDTDFQGQDFVFYTLGDDFLVSAPVPLEDVYLHGIRPYVMGYGCIESHQPFPAGRTEIGKDLQAAANDLKNQRTDNVLLALNKRHFIKNKKTIDIAALKNNVPGGSVTMDDPETDVKVISTPDVTASSYQEQDRLDLDFDDVLGTFSQSSVMANRKLNETVGGMEMLNAGADAVTEYDLSVFSNTWYKMVLKQLVMLEQTHETDEVVLALAASKAKLFQRYGINEITDKLLNSRVTVRVNVGMGNTDPRQRVQKMAMGMSTVSAMPTAMMRLKEDEVISEIFGALGYADGERFFDSLEDKPPPEPPPDPQAIKVQIEAQLREAEMERQHAEFQAKLELERELRYAEIESKERMQQYELQIRWGTAQSRDQLKAGDQTLKAHDIQTRRDSAALKANVGMSEMALKTRMGSGI